MWKSPESHNPHKRHILNGLKSHKDPNNKESVIYPSLSLETTLLNSWTFEENPWTMLSENKVKRVLNRF